MNGSGETDDTEASSEPNDADSGSGFQLDAEAASGEGALALSYEDNAHGWSLLDGARSRVPVVSPELKSRVEAALDLTLPLHERLEAYEDVLESEVGDTTLSRARNIERETGLRQLYLKFEGSNPSGTQKDRIAFAQVMDAMRRGFDGITVATCGNYGVAMAIAASTAGLRCLVYIPERYRTRRIQEMVEFGAEIVRVPGDYENAVVVSREQAERFELYDANPGGDNTTLQLRAYGEIAYEIYDELRDAPAVVCVPVSNGTTLAGIYKGFVSLHRRGKTSRIPRMIAGSSHNKNPIIRAFLKNSDTCQDLRPESIRETETSEPLVNWHSIDGDHALTALRATNGQGAYASDRGMRRHAKMVRDREGLNALPASTAGLSVLLDIHRKNPLPADRYVVILTGRK